MSFTPQDGFWLLSFKLPVSGWTLSGHSRCRERTGFLLKEPRIFLDAGVGCTTPNASAILLTHTHFDHAGALPSLMRGPPNPPSIFVPFQVLNRVRDFTRMSWAIKIDDDKPLPKEYAPDLSAPAPQPGIPFYDQRCVWVPCEAGVTAPLLHALPQHATRNGAKESGKRTNNPLMVTAVRCFHTVSTVGYVLSERRTKLKDEFKSLLGREIAALRSAGTAVQETRDVPLLAYLCDSTVAVLETPGQAELIFRCPAIMIECTYLEDGMKQEAQARGHVCWCDLRPHAEAHPDTLFILFHFSQRYTEDEIRAFFCTASSTGSAPRNVVLWLDSGIVDFRGATSANGDVPVQT
eukprot:TRINITY_DN31354_c0_g1_i1.p1 TRINITY_DN31354_c0_g1~~TRINITY_DN31354_c0_g1_i1.p1  ORF type:complete len:350 (+),score=66.87 TRINITY_DN31354_c0_g1_i1:53-1102(+)